jgi:hypothetical protein
MHKKEDMLATCHPDPAVAGEGSSWIWMFRRILLPRLRDRNDRQGLFLRPFVLFVADLPR